MKLYDCGTFTLIYHQEQGRMGMMMLPTALSAPDGPVLTGLKARWKDMDSLLQLHVRGDRYPRDYQAGHSMRHSESCDRFSFVEQQAERTNGELRVATHFATDDGQRAVHEVIWRVGTSYITSQVEYINGSAEDKILEYLASFSLDTLPGPTDDVRLHRIRTDWSAEGRLHSESIDDLHLEPSWMNYGARSERYGQVGSMPARRFFPFLGLENKSLGVTWGATNCCASSWQMELYARNEILSMSGGLADYEFGQWYKIVPSGAAFRSPVSVLTVVQGDIEDACYQLIQYQEPMVKESLKNFRKFAVTFNDFAVSDPDGRPTEESILKALEAVKGKGMTHFVIDAGWYRTEADDWSTSIGDWEVSPRAFPNGMGKVTQAIRDAGMIPGIWFEWEGTGEQSRIYHEKKEWHLHRDGERIRLRERAFLDLRKPEVQAYLEEKVIGFLKRYGFGYIKVDYNDNIGVGCDGAESIGEGLRQAVEASQRFFRRIREEIPDIVIENCASGGQRLEPSMMALCHVNTPSDGYTPVLAANLTRVIHPALCGCGACLRPEWDRDQLFYHLCSCFFGRMCLSGPVFHLKKWQWKMLDDCVAFYKKAIRVILSGRSYRYGPPIHSYRHPEGWQAVVRVGEDTPRTLVIAHTFACPETETCLIEIPWAHLRGSYIVKTFGAAPWETGEDGLRVRLQPFSAAAALLDTWSISPRE